MHGASMQSDTKKIEVKIFCDTVCVYYIWSLIKLIEQKKGKYGIEYSLASASDGPCPHGWGAHVDI